MIYYIMKSPKATAALARAAAAPCAERASTEEAPPVPFVIYIYIEREIYTYYYIILYIYIIKRDICYIYVYI